MLYKGAVYFGIGKVLEYIVYGRSLSMFIVGFSNGN